MDEPVQTGKTLGGRYAIGERLGKGGWGSVYAAVQTDLGRPVAVKVLHTSVALTSDGIARFEREAKAAAALGHPNIAQVSDFQSNPGEPPFLVLELLTGSTLGTTLRITPKLPPARAVWIAYQILAGLDVAHRAGIVHRDIKPDNVFLVAMAGVEDYVKLLDFGVAKLAGDVNAQLTSTGTMLGSPAFMAPEQVHTSQVDHRADLYAVGATLYLALSGRMPYQAETIHSLLLAITETRPPTLISLDPTIEPSLSAVIERAMHKDPAGRFASAAEMRAALEPWIGARRPMGASEAAVTMTAGSPPLAGPSLAGPPLGTPPPGPPLGTPPPGVNPYAPVATNQQPPPMPPPMMMTPAMAPGMTPQSAPPPAKGSGAVVGLLVVVVILLLIVVGGGIAGFVYYSSHTEPPVPGSLASGSSPVPGSLPPTASASVAANGVPTPSGAAAGASAHGAKPGAPTATVPGAVAPPAVPALPGAPAILPDAAAPAANGKAFSGRTFSVNGGVFDVYDPDQGRAAINARAGAINACYAATEFDPPDHQATNWTFSVDPAGNVRSVGRTTNFELHPKFDACMIPALRSVKWPATKAGGNPHLSFSSRAP